MGTSTCLSVALEAGGEWLVVCGTDKDIFDPNSGTVD